jgi:hypothetical protein
MRGVSREISGLVCCCFAGPAELGSLGTVTKGSSVLAGQDLCSPPGILKRDSTPMTFSNMAVTVRRSHKHGRSNTWAQEPGSPSGTLCSAEADPSSSSSAMLRRWVLWEEGTEKT